MAALQTAPIHQPSDAPARPFFPAGPYETAEIEELLGAKLTDLYEGNASALRVLGANGAPRHVSMPSGAMSANDAMPAGCRASLCGAEW